MDTTPDGRHGKSESWVREWVGWSELAPSGNVEAGAWGTWELTYHVGRYGVDDGGTIVLSRRFASDWAKPQTDAPDEPHYASVTTSGSASLRIRWDPKSNIRPWQQGLAIDVFDSYLAEGDTVTIVLGDTSGGGAGTRAQTFCEKNFRFRLFVDCFGSNRFIEAADTPAFSIVPGIPARLVVHGPTEQAQDETSWMQVKLEDIWGNPCHGLDARVSLTVEGGICEGLPGTVQFKRDEPAVARLENLRWESGKWGRIRGHAEGDIPPAYSNYVYAMEKNHQWQPFWGDLHGQSEETVGTNTADDYFTFARDMAGAQFTCHQGNDFQVTKDTWNAIRAATQKYNDPGRFVTFLGVEWSAVTGMGGDRNVMYLGDDGPLHRTSHWQLEDWADQETDRYPLDELYGAMEGRSDITLIPHIGGRRASLDYHHAELERIMEIYSSWGRFEWFVEEALENGWRVGITAGSDGHKGRPGASYPGAAIFGVYGGYVCIFAAELTRESLWEAIQARRVYATTGKKIHLSFSTGDHFMGEEFESSTPPVFKVRAMGECGIESIELKRASKTICSYRPKDAIARNSDWFRVSWSGARIHQRNRQTHWHGGLRVDKGRIEEPRNWQVDNLEEGIQSADERNIQWLSRTTGDADGVEFRHTDGDDATLFFETEVVSFEVKLNHINAVPYTIEAGGVRQQVEVQRISPTTGNPYANVTFNVDDSDFHDGWNPYFIRLMQEDGALAWSSPIFAKRVKK